MATALKICYADDHKSVIMCFSRTSCGCNLRRLFSCKGSLSRGTLKLPRNSCPNNIQAIHCSSMLRKIIQNEIVKSCLARFAAAFLKPVLTTAVHRSVRIEVSDRAFKSERANRTQGPRLSLKTPYSAQNSSMYHLKARCAAAAAVNTFKSSAGAARPACQPTEIAHVQIA
jgi:hypothetical protein